MTRALRALIVEDSAVIRESLVAALEELAPVDVMATADTESAAVAWLVEHGKACDLAVIDVFLRQGSGIGVLQAAASFAPKASKVVLSNYATAEMRARCLALGASRVYDKSHEIDALIEYCATLARELPEDDIPG